MPKGIKGVVRKAVRRAKAVVSPRLAAAATDRVEKRRTARPEKRKGRPRLSGELLKLQGTVRSGRPRKDGDPVVIRSKPIHSARPEQAVMDAYKWPRPYLQIAEDYARRAADPKNSSTFCRWMRLAGQRYLNDRVRARTPNAPFYFDEWSAQRPCEFIEGLPHVEGTWDSDLIVLHPSDVFFLINLFGFRNQDGSRRFTNALKAVARKNAKSTIAAAIGLYVMNCEDEQGPQVLSAATTGSQARIIFNIARRMVDVAHAMRHKYNLTTLANAIVNKQCFGGFKPINAKASTQDGLNPSCVLLDEIHAHKNHDLVNVLRSAAGARRNALFLFTTTEGYETPGPWPELRQFAKQVLDGTVQADHFLVVYYALDDEQGKKGSKGYVPADDEFDERTWIKANPLLDVNPILLTKIREEAIEAKRLPGRLAEFRIKRLNRPSASAGAWVNLVQWKACASPPLDLSSLGAAQCWGGLDLASTRDIASFRLVWKIDNIWYTHGWRFVPRKQVGDRSERGMVPYKGWRDAGFLIECGDEVIDYDAIEKVILDCRNKFNIRSIGYDGWNASQLAEKLKQAKVPMELFIQGTKSYHPAMKELERAYAEQKIRHEDDPVLNWCVSNLIARTDVNMNMAPERKNAPDKIDDVVALLMALGQAIGTKEQGKAFQFFVV